METILLFLSLMVSVKSVFAAPSIEKLFDISSKADNAKISDLSSSEEKSLTEWKSHWEFCWENQRIKTCSDQASLKQKQTLKFLCQQSHSANCSTPSCRLIIDDKESKTVQEVTEVAALKGQYRDFLLIRGRVSGCGGTSYELHVLDDGFKVRCSFSESVADSDIERDVKASNILEKIYKNPIKYIQWADANCNFRLSKKEQEILKNKQ